MEENMIIEPLEFQEPIFTIILSDGSRIENLKMNGNNFISQTEITKEMFAGKLDKVTFTDGNMTVEHGHMDLMQITRGPFANSNDPEWWFVLRDLTKLELFEMQARSDMDFLAMMTGVDLT